MRIAIIAPSEIPARRANTIQVMKMAQALVRLGHQVSVLAPGYKKQVEKRKSQVDELKTASGIAWENLSRQYGLSTRFPLVSLPCRENWRRYDFSLAAVRYGRSWDADCVYTRLPQAAALAAISGMRTILEVHDLPQGFTGPALFRLFLTGRGACRVVCITKALADDLINRFGVIPTDTSLVISPDGVDLERYQTIPRPEDARLVLNEKMAGQLRRELGRFTAGYTGHLYPGRGVGFLLELAKKLPEIDFLLVGGEPYDISLLQKKITKRNLDNVIVVGFIPNSDLPLFQAASDILLMPYQKSVAASSGGDISRYLSPMKLFEYLACGRPILSSDLPVFREVLGNQNAFLLPAAEIESWTRTIRLLHDEPDRRDKMGAHARQDAKNFTWEKRAERILEGLT